jgi:hypothetical protein
MALSPNGVQRQTVFVAGHYHLGRGRERVEKKGPTTMKFPSMPAMPVLLSVTAGYVDTAGYLALQRLFIAHVTGNFVTGAHAGLGHGHSKRRATNSSRRLAAHHDHDRDDDADHD